MLVVCAGTGTDVGKTWVGAGVLGALRRRGVAVAARKPAQSFPAGEATTDADVLAAATGEDVHVVCPPHRWYPLPMAPPMAAAALGRPAVRLADLVAEITWPAASPSPSVRWVESAGGVLSPLAEDGDAADLVQLLDPDLVVLVADAGLGTINAVRSAAGPLAPHRVLVLLNRFDRDSDLHVRNEEWLRSRCGFDVETAVEGICARLGGRLSR